ncbi:hypothetical protein ACHAQA_007059 [Verticillium albo-atrum]
MKYSITALLLVAGLAMAAPAVQPEVREPALEKRSCGPGFLCMGGRCHYNSCNQGGCTLLPTNTRC